MAKRTHFLSLFIEFAQMIRFLIPNQHRCAVLLILLTFLIIKKYHLLVRI